MSDTDNKEFPLINRYGAAWLEHDTRITLRQNMVQIYLTSVAIVFGFYFNALGREGGPPLELIRFLVIAVTLLTCFTSAVIWQHNRAIQQIVAFLYRCELEREDVILTQAHRGDSCLLYFLDPRSEVGSPRQLQPLHRKLRFANRLTIALLLLTTNGFAIFVALRTNVVWQYAVSCGVVGAIACAALFRQTWRDWAHLAGAKRVPQTERLERKHVTALKRLGYEVVLKKKGAP